jgi:hypothetical protein
MNPKFFAQQLLGKFWIALYTIGGMIALLISMSAIGVEMDALVLTKVAVILLGGSVLALSFILVRKSQMRKSIKDDSYQTWQLHVGNELKFAIYKVVKDYKNDGKYYDGKLEVLYREIRYSISHAAAASILEQYEEWQINELVRQAEGNLHFDPMSFPIGYNPEITNGHTLYVNIWNDGSFRVSLVNREFTCPEVSRC